MKNIPQNAGEKMPIVILSHGFGGKYQVGAGHGFHGSDAEQTITWMLEYLESHKN